MPYVRRIVLVVVAALASASAAFADGTPPTVTLLSPANGATVALDGNHNPTFSWQISYAQPQTETALIELTVSADPAFQGTIFSTTRACGTSSPACFTSLTPQGTYWIIAATGSSALPTKPLTLYWRVTVSWQSAQAPVTSATGAFTGLPAVADKTPPRVAVKATTARRGSRARVHF